MPTDAELHEANERARQWSEVATAMLSELRMDYAPLELGDLDGRRAIKKLRWHIGQMRRLLMHIREVPGISEGVRAAIDNAIQYVPLAEWGAPAWDKNRDQQELCQCGHPYERHFDSYEKMSPVGCKYCECERFLTNGSD